MQLSKLKGLVTEALKPEKELLPLGQQPTSIHKSESNEPPTPASVTLAGNSRPIQQSDRISLWQVLELHPSVMGLTVFGDFFESGFDVVTLGLGVPASFVLSVLAGSLAYRWQRSKSHDPAPLAALKGCLVTCLLWLPSPAFGLLSIPSGLVGMFRQK